MKAAGRPPRRLVSFLTRGMSLEAWRSGGMLARELALFEALRDRGVEVHLVSFGGRGEAALAPPGIRVHANILGLPERPYVELLALRCRGLRGRAVVRTNQVRGGELAALFARRLGLPLVARCGFLPSVVSEHRHGPAAPATQADRALERKVFGAADRIVVATPAQARRVADSCAIDPARIEVIPNYVETGRFVPEPAKAEPDHVIFVGRLSEEKNLGLLLEALSGTPWRLTVIGGGPLRSELEQRARALGVAVRFEGTVPNAELPERLRRAAVFCLPSRFEGHPKALLEAMACGLAVVVTEAPGLSDLVRAGETGLVCAPEPRALRAALASLVDDEARRMDLGRAARRFVLEHCTLEQAVARELAVLDAVAPR